MPAVAESDDGVAAQDTGPSAREVEVAEVLQQRGVVRGQQPEKIDPPAHRQVLADLLVPGRTRLQAVVAAVDTVAERHS